MPESAPPQLAVLAGNFHEYARWCFEHDLPISGSIAFYVNLRKLQGKTNVLVIKTGTWYNRDDLAEIYAMLAVVNKKADNEA